MLSRLTFAVCVLMLGIPDMARPQTLEACTRTTHISHGGEDQHRDLGQGRVIWRDWWSQEGTASDFTIMECAPGTALQFRAAEERMNDRPPFDKTAKAMDVVARHHAGARLFATFDRMAADLEKIARDIRIVTHHTESCACAAAYPALRGTKTAFSPG